MGVHDHGHSDSDLDLLVRFDKPNLLDHIALQQDLEDVCGCPDRGNHTPPLEGPHSRGGAIFVSHNATDRIYLYDIHGAVGKIEQYTAEGREVFLQSPLIQDAVIRNFEIILEKPQNSSRGRLKQWLLKFLGAESLGCGIS